MLAAKKPISTGSNALNCREIVSSPNKMDNLVAISPDQNNSNLYRFEDLRNSSTFDLVNDEHASSRFRTNQLSKVSTLTHTIRYIFS